MKATTVTQALGPGNRGSQSLSRECRPAALLVLTTRAWRRFLARLLCVLVSKPCERRQRCSENPLVYRHETARSTTHQRQRRASRKNSWRGCGSARRPAPSGVCTSKNLKGRVCLRHSSRSTRIQAYLIPHRESRHLLLQSWSKLFLIYLAILSSDH